MNILEIMVAEDFAAQNVPDASQQRTKDSKSTVKFQNLLDRDLTLKILNVLFVASNFTFHTLKT